MGYSPWGHKDRTPLSDLAHSTHRGRAALSARPLALDYSPSWCLWSRGQAGAVLEAHQERLSTMAEESPGRLKWAGVTQTLREG